jgi:hypothetical protein
VKGWIRSVVVACACVAIVSTGQAVGSNGGARAPAKPSPEIRPAPLDLRASVASGEEFAPLRAIAEAEGTVRVIVGLRMLFQAEGLLDAVGVRRQRAQIRSAGDRVLAALQGTRYRVTGRFRFTPSIALELSPQALDALERSGAAGRIQEDEAFSPTLSSSTRIIEATETAAVGWAGAGRTIAILDTGVQKTHRFLQKATGGSKVVGEACFSANANCPGGVTQSTASGSGVPCTYAPTGCRHGTHVAGIAAGRGGTGTGTTMNGGAPGATLYSIQVFSMFTGVDCENVGEDPCALSFDSDRIKGLERVFAVRNSFSFAAVNLSLGGGQFTATCDGAEAEQKAAIDNLLSAGIATVIPSGNDAFSNAVNSPGCISTAITVGSTNDQDTVSLFSNSASMVDFFAPGESITSSVPTGTGPGGTDFDVFDGTSMAAAHVAGAWAVVKGALGTGGSVAQIEATFDATGKQVTDTLASPQITRARIKVLSAAASLVDSGFRGAFSLTGPGVTVRSNGTGLAKRAGGPFSSQITISGIPSGSTVRKVFLYWMTLGGPDASATFEDSPVPGTLIGASANPCWAIPSPTAAVRVYRATLPNATVPGNGTYDIRGVGGTPEVDGTGASLVVVVDRPASSSAGVVKIRDGAFTLAGPGEMASHTFPSLSVPVNPTSLRLNVGVGDGEPLRELWMRFRSQRVTDVKPFSGTDGKMWDDLTVIMPTTLLPAGTTNASNSITTAVMDPWDCLSWAYSALSYRYPSS